MAPRSRDATLQCMTHTLIHPSHPTTRPRSSRTPAGLLTAGRFVLHFAEMWIVMLVGMMVYMAVPGVMVLPPLLHQVGMGISMTVPMIVWMRIRGHGWRHGLEMGLDQRPDRGRARASAGP